MTLEGGRSDATIRGGTFSAVMQYLTSFPNPDLVTRAICHGPLAQFGCQRISIWTHVDYQELVSVANYGPDEGNVEEYRRIPLNVLVPVTHAFIGSTKVILPVGEVVTQYPGLQLDQSVWHLMEQQSNNGDLVAVPMISNGASIGAFAFLCDRQNEWNLRNINLLDGLSAAISLWMSHPLSGVLEVPQNSHYAQLALTLRQIKIVKLVQLGKSNASIAANLGFSESTIKQELQRIMKRLKSRTREQAVERCVEMKLIPPPTEKQASIPLTGVHQS
jgi:DNA-binding CsgD family transcriptional regulator